MTTPIVLLKQLINYNKMYEVLLLGVDYRQKIYFSIILNQQEEKSDFININKNESF